MGGWLSGEPASLDGLSQKSKRQLYLLSDFVKLPQGAPQVLDCGRVRWPRSVGRFCSGVFSLGVGRQSRKLGWFGGLRE
jgi:hypothetical protein